MPVDKLGAEWNVEWAAKAPHGETYSDWLILDRDQAEEYGDELVNALRVDGEMMRKRGLDPDEPFAYRVEDGELLTKQISRQIFEWVAESDRDDASYAKDTLQHRAEMRARNLGYC